MNRKNLILVVIISATAIVAIILFSFGKPAYPVMIFGALISFIIYGVYTPPDKHKTFGYRDQQRAMRAFDRTDLLDFQIGSSAGKKRKKTKS